MGNKPNSIDQQPQTAGQLLGMILKKLPKQLLKTLPLTILIGTLGFLVNFWLMAYVNDGFNPGTWTSKNLIPVTGQMFSSIVLWGITGAIIPLGINFVKSGGDFGKAISGFFSLPTMVFTGLKNGNARFKGILSLAVAASLLLENLLSGVSGLVAGSIVMTSVVAFVTGRGSVFIQLIRLAANDVSRFILKKPGLNMTEMQISTVIGASGLGLMVLGFLKMLATNFDLIMIGLNALWLIFFILGLILILTNKPISGQMIFILVFMGSSLLFAQMDIVLADDGGRSEIGGTIWDYIRGQGAMEVIIRCIPPGLAAALGSLFGALAGEVGGTTGTYINYGNDPGEERDMIVTDPATGAQTRYVQDPVTGEWVDPIYNTVLDPSKLPQWFRDRQKVDDYRERNAQLDRENQAQREKEEAERRDLQNKLDKLNSLKDRMYKAAQKMDDPEERDKMFERLESIRKMQKKFLKGEGDLKLSLAAKMYGNAISGKTMAEGNLPDDYDWGQHLADTILLTGEEIGRGDGFLVGALQTAVVVGAGMVCLPAAVVVEGGFIVSKAVFGMKDYVDSGGDSALEGFVIVSGTAVKDEMWGWGTGAAFKGAKAGKEAWKTGKSIKSGAKDVGKAMGKELAENTKVPKYINDKVSKLKDSPGLPDKFVTEGELAKARRNLDDKIKQKEAILDKHNQKIKKLQKQVEADPQIKKKANTEAGNAEAANNRYRDQIDQSEQAAETARKKAEKLEKGDPKRTEYEQRADAHDEKIKNLNKKIEDNKKYISDSRKRADAAESDYKQSKKNLKNEQNAPKQADSEYSKEYNKAKEEVTKARNEMSKVAKDDFIKGTTKEAAKNTFEATETSQKVERWWKGLPDPPKTKP